MKKKIKTDFETRWRQRFEAYAKRSDDDAGIAGWSPHGLATRLRHFRRVWPRDKKGSFWLDVGCGAGTYTRLLADTGINVLGADYSEPTVQKARRRGTNQITWLVSDINKLPLPAGYVDGVLCFGVIQALSESNIAINEMARVMRQGGMLWIDGLNGRCIPTIFTRLKRWVRRSPMHLRYESPTMLMELMRQHGFECLQHYWVPILPARLHIFQPLIESVLVVWLFRYVPFLGSLLSHAFVVTGKKKY